MLFPLFNNPGDSKFLQFSSEYDKTALKLGLCMYCVQFINCINKYLQKKMKTGSTYFAEQIKANYGDTSPIWKFFKLMMRTL
jgi:hypothetical protein